MVDVISFILGGITVADASVVDWASGTLRLVVLEKPASSTPL